MRIRLSTSWDWRIPGKGLSCIAFPAGDHLMTHQQGQDAIAAGVGTELPDDAPTPPKPDHATKAGRRK